MQKVIKIGFTKSLSPFSIMSPLIRFYQGTEYSHVYIELEDQEVPLIYQADVHSVYCIHRDIFLSDNRLIEEYSINVDMDVYYAILKHCKERLGYCYSYTQILNIFFTNAFSLNRIPFVPANRSYTCSEFVGEILNKFIFKVSSNLDLVTPRDIEHLILKNLPMISEV